MSCPLGLITSSISILTLEPLTVVVLVFMPYMLSSMSSIVEVRVPSGAAVTCQMRRKVTPFSSKVPCQSPASLAWAGEKGSERQGYDSKNREPGEKYAFHESPYRGERFPRLHKVLRLSGGHSMMRMVPRSESGFQKSRRKCAAPTVRDAGFPDPAGAPTIGLLWAKRRQILSRLHAPTAGR